MPPSRRAAWKAAPVLAVVLSLAACGDDGDDGDGADPGTTTSSAASSTSTTTTEAETTTTEALAATTTAPVVDHGDEEEGLAELEALVPRLLVAAAELGPDVEEIGFRPPEVVDCGIDGTHPSDVLAGTGLQAATQIVEESIRIYPSLEAAQAAFDAWIALPASCSYGFGVALGSPSDVNDVVAADRSVAYEAVRSGDATVTLVVALVGDAVIATSVVGTPGLDPMEVASFAVGKVLAALEA